MNDSDKDLMNEMQVIVAKLIRQVEDLQSRLDRVESDPCKPFPSISIWSSRSGSRYWCEDCHNSAHKGTCKEFESLCNDFDEINEWSKGKLNG